MALLCLNPIIVSVFPKGYSVDGDILIHLLRRFEGVIEVAFVVIRFCFVDRRILPDPKGAQVTQAIFETNSYGMLPKRGIWSDDKGRLKSILVFPFGEIFDRDSGLVEKDLLRLEKTVTAKGNFYLSPKLSAPRSDDVDLGRVGKRTHEGKCEE